MLLRNTRARHAASDRSGQARQQRGGDTMTTHTYASIASIATLAAFTVIGPVCAGGDKVAFPENHEAGVLFTTVDRPDNKQFREVYTSAATLEAAKNGEPLPDGTVITMLQYAAKLDAQGNPEKDANGRFIKGNLIGYAVMEKRTGWGSEYPDSAQRGVGVPVLQGRQDGEQCGQSQRLLHLPQAAGQAGLCLPLRQDESGGEIALAPNTP